MIPSKEKWRVAALIALPGHKVLVVGLIWDQYNLTPWVYDLKENTWSHKLTPDGNALPSFPKETKELSASFLENKVYLSNRKDVFILDLSTCERWNVVNLPQSHGNIPITVPFSPTMLGIVGGTG